MRYSELTRRYFAAAADTAGRLEGAGVARGAAGSRAEGTWVQFDVRIDRAAADGPRVAAARFLAFGCPHTIAAAAWVAEQAVGRVPEPALPQSAQALRRLFEMPVEKLGRLLIVEDAWLAAVRGDGAKSEH
ncbi:MAG TPA: iron-sulfur cluster assembly scaffold protein [Steroidobacteraceae bacterium]|nr:iron-sulfur cluster assembly scaffold protein [Steroidobacteraceae bacterium]